MNNSTFDTAKHDFYHSGIQFRNSLCDNCQWRQHTKTCRCGYKICNNEKSWASCQFQRTNRQRQCETCGIKYNIRQGGQYFCFPCLFALAEARESIKKGELTEWKPKS